MLGITSHHCYKGLFKMISLPKRRVMLSLDLVKFASTVRYIITDIDNKLGLHSTYEDSVPFIGIEEFPVYRAS